MSDSQVSEMQNPLRNHVRIGISEKRFIFSFCFNAFYEQITCSTNKRKIFTTFGSVSAPLKYWFTQRGSAKRKNAEIHKTDVSQLASISSFLFVFSFRKYVFHTKRGIKTVPNLLLH